MALSLKNVSFSRQVLPVVALVGLVIAVLYIVTGLPDRELEEPSREPPRATGELAGQNRVAGAGIVEPSSEIVSVGTALSGLLTAIRVEPGDIVQQGQPLFTVDDRAARASLTEANAQIAEAKAAIAEASSARETADRQLALFRNVEDPAAVSRSEVIRAEGEAAAARQRLELARSRLSAAEARANSVRTEIGRLTVRAPITGEILSVDKRVGEFVSAGGPQGAGSEPILQMGETRPLHIRIDIDEEQATRIKEGAPAIVSPRGDASRQVEAQFVRIEPLVVPKRSLTNSAAERVDVRVVQAIYALPMSEEGFRVGQQVDAYIPAREGAR